MSVSAPPTTFLELLVLFFVIALIIILIKPSILKFMKPPNRKKGLLFWFLTYIVVYLIYTDTPTGKKELAEYKDKHPEIFKVTEHQGEEDVLPLYYYRKPQPRYHMWDYLLLYPIEDNNNQDTTK
jgi:hypothetical protein